MAYDFWDKMKKFLKGDLKVGDGSNSITVIPTLNPVENIANIQKLAAMKNQSKPQQAAAITQNTAGIKPPVQLNTQGKTGGYVAPQNPVLKNIADMVLNNPDQNDGNALNLPGKAQNIVTKINPVLKNIQDMISNAGKQNISTLNTQNKTDDEINMNYPIKQNEKLQSINNTMQNELNDYSFSNEKNDEAHIESSRPSDVKYEFLNSELNIPIMIDGNNFLINFVKEKNRNEAIEKVKELNGFSNSKFDPILNEMKNAKTVSFESSQQNISVDVKRREALENNEIKGNIKTLITLWNLGGLGKNIVKSLINQCFNLPSFISEELISNGANDFIDSLLDKTATKYTGYDKQGVKIDKITRQYMNIQFSKDSIKGESYIGKSKIIYEYHIVDNARRILSILVNGNEVYNNYQN